MKKFFIAIILSLLVPINCYAMTAHDLAMSYILADQNPPKEPGDKFYTLSENDSNPILMETTGYHQGTTGSHGDKMREGYAACAPEMYGDAVMVYEAIPQDDGSYKLGEYINTFEIKDCGYGYSTGEGKSEVRNDKKYAGTIETGIHLDVYRDNLSRCWDWMHRTNGKIFAVIIEGKG